MKMMTFGTMAMIVKGSTVSVTAPTGKSIECPVIDVEGERIWVRLPTNAVLDLRYDPRRKLYVGVTARMEFTVAI
jgi:hypothetical protein